MADDNALSRGLSWVDNWLARLGQREARPIWNPDNPIGTETLATMGMPQDTTYAGRLGQYFDPSTGRPTLKGQDRLANPLLGIDTGGVGAVGAIRGYHGSPHLFEPTARNPLGEFRDSAIGTGEGNQAFGMGHYIAEEERVAQDYRDQLRWKGADWHDPQTIAQNAIDRARGDRAAAADNLQSALDSNTNFYRGNVPAAQAAANEKTASAIALLRGTEPITGAPPTPGHMYEADIHADPEHFLDWDKPLSEQSPLVQGAVRNLTARGMLKGVNENSTGQDIHTALMTTNNNRIANYGKAGAAQTLQDAGLPGIRYLDAGSRAGGEGTRNYVVFDPATIQILRRYGIAGLIGGGGAAALSGQGDDVQ